MTEATPPRGVQGSGDPTQEVQQLIERLADALNHGDDETLVELWQPPAFLLGDPEVHAISSNEEIRQFFAQRGQPREPASIRQRPRIVTLQWPSARVALVEVCWTLIDAADREVGAQTVTYAVRRNERGGWVLRVAVLHQPH